MTMLNQVFDRFVTSAPATVMLRGVLENILSADRLDAIFRCTALAQYTRELAFSSVVWLMSQVVTRIRPSIHAAWKAEEKALGVSAKSVYDKLDGIEPQVSRELVRRTAQEMESVILSLDAMFPPLLPGFRTRILDGNHLAGTDRRLMPLRTVGGAALPGQALVVLDPALKLIVDVFPCEDAHTQERALLAEVLGIVEPNDLWIEDRNFCTTKFVFGVADGDAAFLVRQHAQSLHWDLLGERVYVGEIETGRVFEQRVRLANEEGKEPKELEVRRITIELHQPTRDGDMTLHLLTNVDVKDADALTLARLYCKRWLIETAFQEMTVDLACEVSTLGYPKAALFAFCVAAVCYNALSVVKAAMRAKGAGASRIERTPIESDTRRESEEQPRIATAPETMMPAMEESCGSQDASPFVVPVAASLPRPADETSPNQAGSLTGVCGANTPTTTTRAVRASRHQPLHIDDLSTYYLADEVSRTWRGMMIAIPGPFWEQAFGALSPAELARALTELISRVDNLAKYRKRPPSRKPAGRKSPCKPSHVSTARELRRTAKNMC